ncbi:DUF4298 domain-containing protein [Glaesserella sp.]|uniref:DUF4298 domain-containing protein n=1 Tax=Glaesserella sp. TaxID=2094731 RepID=UPI0035A0E6A7
MSQTIQQRIQQIQHLYREWLELQPTLQQAQSDWQRSAEIINTLEKFYFEGEYQDYFQQIEQGLEVDLTTEGEDSVMSEDTLWNAFYEQQQTLWQQLRFAVAQLDHEKSR